MLVKKPTLKLLYGGGSTFYKDQNAGLGPKNLTVISDQGNFTLDCGGEFKLWSKDIPDWIRRAYRNRVVVPDLSMLKDNPIDFAWLSHSHFDHCVYIPGLEPYFREDSRIYGGPHTLDIIRKVYIDTLRQSPYVYQNIPGILNYPDIGGVFGVVNSLKRNTVLPLGRQQIMPGIALTTGIAGHILGAAYGIFEIEGGPTLLDTGDIAFFNQPLVPGSTLIEDLRLGRVPLPDIIVGTDFTNPSLEPFSWEKESEKFRPEIRQCIDENKTIIIGAFENSRSQNVATDLREYLDSVGYSLPIYIDGGGRDVYEVYKKHSGQWCAGYPEIKTESIEYIKSREHRRTLLETPGPKLIITTAGMFDGGPIEEYLEYGLQREDFVFIATSYVAPRSKAAALLEATRENPHPIIKFNGKKIRIGAKIERVHFSAHGTMLDFVEIVKAIYETNGNRRIKIMTTHGRKDTKEKAVELVKDYADCFVVRHDRAFDVSQNADETWEIQKSWFEKVVTA